jgi:predicted amidohydrolase
LEKGGHYYNSLVWMRPDGSYELYFKRHTFTMGGEDKLVERGEKQLIVELKGWRIRPMVCYDIRFPVWARNRYENGQYEYDLAFYLANFPDSRMIVWNTLLVARAIENQAYWIGVNRVGEDANDLHYSGESQVINSRGEVISKAEAYKEYGDAAKAQMVIEKLPEIAKAVAEPIAAIKDVRVYGGTAEGVSQMSMNVPAIIKQTMDVVSDTTGVNMSDIMQSMPLENSVKRVNKKQN